MPTNVQKQLSVPSFAEIGTRVALQLSCATCCVVKDFVRKLRCLPYPAITMEQTAEERNLLYLSVSGLRMSNKTKQRVSKNLNKGFVLSFIIQSCPHYLESEDKKNGLDSLFPERLARTRSSATSRAVKNTARSRVLLLRIFGGLTEKVLFNATLLGDYVIVKNCRFVLLHLQRLFHNY